MTSSIEPMLRGVVHRGALFLLIILLAVVWAMITIVDAVATIFYRLNDLRNRSEYPTGWVMAVTWTRHMDPLFALLKTRYHMDNSQVTPAACRGPTIGVITHPSSLGTNRFVRAWTETIDGPHRFAIKEELRRWPIGIGLRIAGADIPIPRSDYRTSVQRLQRSVVKKGSAVILPEGTRPRMVHAYWPITRLLAFLQGKRLRPKNTITAARQRLRETGLAEIADDYWGGLWRDTGITTLLRVNPNAALVVQISFSEVHEEGFRGAFDMFGRGFYDKLVEIDRTHLPIFQNDELRRRFWNELGAAVWRYVSAVREGRHGIDEEFHFDWNGHRVTIPSQA